MSKSLFRDLTLGIIQTGQGESKNNGLDTLGSILMDHELNISRIRMIMES